MSRYIQPHQSTQPTYQRTLHPQAVHKQQCRSLMWNIIPPHPQPQPQPHPLIATGTHWRGTTSMSLSSLLRLQLYSWWQPLPQQEWSSVSAQPAEGKPFNCLLVQLPTLKVGPASWQEGFVIITWFVWIKESTRCWHQHMGSCHNPVKGGSNGSTNKSELKCLGWIFANSSNSQIEKHPYCCSVVATSAWY